nr:MAG TPA: hypothetical protein [Caudoviricetes sp.]
MPPVILPPVSITPVLCGLWAGSFPIWNDRRSFTGASPRWKRSIMTWWLTTTSAPTWPL